ncbi:sigma-54-dependent Fis family transcriptional regulator [Clostridiaceae bacterium 35-E11]
MNVEPIKKEVYNKTYISLSHKRCEQMGIDMSRVYSTKILNGEQLQRKLEQKKELIITAEPFLNQLYNFVKGSGFFAILTDEEGCILTLIGDEDILSEAFSLKMIPGAYMDEKSIGTNAMGTTLYEGRAVQISGEEHFVKVYHRWTCSGAPIRDEKGKIVGSIDLTGYSELVHSHTLGMVVAAANAIEKMMQVNKYSGVVKTSKLYTQMIIDSIPTGILTSDINGNLKVINQYVVKMFGYQENEMKQMKIWDLFEGWEKVKNILREKRSFLDEDVFVKARKNKVQFTLSAYPMLEQSNKLQDIIFVFKEVKKARKLANKIMGRQAVYSFDKVIGEDENLLNTIEFAKKVADSKSTILILGESGTGKEVIAQSIHNYSNRSEESFVALNCAAIPRNLIEAELFGYEEGSFTGAKKGGQPGKFEIADGGTIFLDEIGEMPLDMQTRLLRAIEEGTVSRIGSSDEIIVDVRIIAATNKDLTKEVSRGNFRKDLYYRLNVLPLRLPPLRSRKKDIPLLVDCFMKRISKRLNKKSVEIPQKYMNQLMNYEWPGNVRELENFIELVINVEYLPPLEANKEIEEVTELIDCEILEESCYTLEQVEKMHIIKMLKKCGGNITLTAEKLGIGRNTLYRKMQKHKINCTKMERCAMMEQ